MDKATLQASLERWEVSFRKFRDNLILRTEIPELPTHELGLAISGVRRCGKTSTAIQLSKKFKACEVLYYNFEDPQFIGTETPAGIETLFAIFEQKYGVAPELTILDEVQNVTGWERWVRTAID